MIAVLRAVSIGSLIPVVIGCGEASTPVPASPMPTTTPSGMQRVVTRSSLAPGFPTQTTTPSGMQHVEAGPVGLEAPANWSLRVSLPNPSGNVTYAFLSHATVPSECRETGQGGACHPWPIVKLAPGEIVVAVRQHGMPGSDAALPRYLDAAGIVM